MDMKNRAAAAKLTPLDDELVENTAVRIAATSTTPPASESEPIDFASEEVIAPEDASPDEPPLSSIPEPTPQDLRAMEDGGGDSMLARYFRDMAAHQVMGPDEELQTAKEVEQAEVHHWVALLSFLPVAEQILDALEESIRLANDPEIQTPQRRIVAMSFCEPRSCRLQLSS